MRSHLASFRDTTLHEAKPREVRDAIRITRDEARRHAVDVREVVDAEFSMVADGCGARPAASAASPSRLPVNGLELLAWSLHRI
jgi:hypothetical protein